VKVATAQHESASGQNLLKLALGETKPKVDDNADALRKLAGQAGSAKDEIKGLDDTIRGFGKAQFDVNAATRQFQQAILDAESALKSNGKTLNIQTQRGIDNRAALDGLARSTLELSAATLDQTGSQQKASDVIKTGRDQVIKMGEAFGLTKAGAERYADSLGLIPSNVKTSVQLSGVREAENTLAYLTRSRAIQIAVRTVQGGSGTATGGNIARAQGGPVYGPGTSTSDSIPALLSNGEYVINARQTAQHYALIEAINRGTYRGYAAGGFVQPMYSINVPQLAPPPAHAPGVVIQQDIHPAQGMSEEQIGRIAAEKTAFALRGA
jgi:hypothetical protein